jgi:hypothetical protein
MWVNALEWAGCATGLLGAWLLALERLSNRYGVTKREMLERLIVAEDKRILSGIELDSPEWDNHFGKAIVTR